MTSTVKLQIGILFCLILLLPLPTVSQVYRNNIHSGNIRTLTVYPDGEWSALPILKLGSEGRIQVSFDELSHDYHRYSYRVIHCNANWKRSEMAVPEYLDGFPENDVDEGEQSISTLTLYTHYSFSIPNDNVKLFLSGNYAVEVFDKYNDRETLLTACFMVTENRAQINASVTATTDIDYKKQHQQLNFSIQPVGFSIRQPLNDIQVVVQQNNRRDLEVRNIAPLNISGDVMTYEHNPELIFEGGNEYRRFEMTTYKYPGLNVNRVEYFKPFYNVELLPSDCRNTGYTYDKDQNGRFLVHSQEAQDDETGSEYFIVHFSIPMKEPVLDGGFYLNGDFVNNRLNSDTKLLYNFEHGAYEKSLLLKQGAYNFQYVFKPTAGEKVSATPMEGSYWETENEYQIYVYYRPFGERYDRLIAFKQVQTTF
jgi:hypothetical protein